MAKKILLLCWIVVCPEVSFSQPIYFPETKKEEGFLQLKSEWFTFGAEFESEFLAHRGDDDFAFKNGNQGISHANRHKDRFSINKLTLIPQFNFKDKIHFYSELEAFVNRSEIDDTFFREAHVTVFPIPQLFVKAGLDDRFISPEFSAENDAIGDDKRLTEVFPINGTAFWKDEDVGITIGGNHPYKEKTTFYWRGSYTNGLNLHHDEITRNHIYPILHDDRDASNINIDLNGDREYGAGIGVRHLLKEDLRFNIFGFFYYNDDLASTDREFLRDVIRGYSHAKNRHHLAGCNLSFKFPYVDLFSQFIRARNGTILRHGFYAEPSFYLTTAQREFLNGMRLLYRFNYLDIDAKESVNISSNPLLWNRLTHSFGFNIQIHKYVLLRNEFHWNKEDTEGSPAEVVNNEFLSQIEVKF